MAVERCPRCDRALSSGKAVHWSCFFRRASIPISIAVLTVLVVLSGSLLVVHFVK